MAIYDVSANILSTNTTAFDYDRTVKSIAHRGYSTTAPENTLPSFRLAKHMGFYYVECDIRFTGDNNAMLLHDATVDRTSNGTGAIADMTYEQIRQCDFGSWKGSKYANIKLPNFKEFIALCRNLGLHPYIEIKHDSSHPLTESQVRSLVNRVKSYGMIKKVTWISSNTTYLNYVKKYDPYSRLAPVVSSINESTITTAQGLLTGTNEVFIDAKYDGVTDAMCTLCMNANLPLEVWTISSTTADYSNIISSLNPYISGITSNDLIVGQLLYNKNIGKLL